MSESSFMDRGFGNSNILQERLPCILEIRAVEKVVLSYFNSSYLTQLQIGFSEPRKL